MHQFSFDFRDPWFDYAGYRFALRVFTLENVYSPDPDDCEIAVHADRFLVRSKALRWAGGQQTAEGAVELRVRRLDEGRLELAAQAWHGSARIKGLGLLLQGRDFWRAGSGLEAELRPVDYSGFSEAYPGFGGRVPAFFFGDQEGKLYFALSKDRQVRRKAFAAYRHPLSGVTTIELHHEEDARRFSTEIEVPPWHLGPCRSRDEVFEERCRDLEQHFGLKPFEEREDVPDWFRAVSLVLNMHCEHWTGYVFNTFEDLSRKLEWVCERIEGRHCLAYLPGWDGRYYYQYPAYEPSPRCGGPAGFRAFVQRAHELGAHVIPMLGFCWTTYQQMADLGLEEAITQDPYGVQRIGDWVDWDSDRRRDSFARLANMGHPGYREHMFRRICALKDEYGIDGVFLDISSMWENDPRYSVYEGAVELARLLHERYDDFLLFGENWYDALLGVYPIMHDRCTSPGVLFRRYARMAQHLSHPAPGPGSSGVHEFGFAHVSGEQRQGGGILPTLPLVDTTLPGHAEECEQIIARAKALR